jgi:hypothetical protein
MWKSPKRIAYRIRDFMIGPLLQRTSTVQSPDPVSQFQLKLTYRALVDTGGALPDLNQVGFKVYSQTDEDGILLYIFSIIGTVNKLAVEMCAGNGIECNSANLIINHGWHGLLFDGDEALVKEGLDFYTRNVITHPSAAV